MKKTFALPTPVTAAVMVLLVSLRASGAPSLEEVRYPPVDESDGRTPLYFSLIQSFSGQYISAYSLVGLELALDLINNDTALIPGYSLHYVFTDAPVSLRTFIATGIPCVSMEGRIFLFYTCIMVLSRVIGKVIYTMTRESLRIYICIKSPYVSIYTGGQAVPSTMNWK